MSQKLSTHLINNNLFETFQSALRACHSTQTALTKVVNYILHSDFTSVFLLLDLGAEFHTIDHSIYRLKNQQQICS